MIPARAPAPVLRALGVGDSAFLGCGSEAAVYALPGDRVARVHEPAATAAAVAERVALLAELAASADAVPFALPVVLDTAVVADRHVSIEVRLPGRTLSDVLAEATGARREHCVRAYLDAAARIGDLTLRRDGFGDLHGPNPVRAATFRGYLHARAQRSLASGDPSLAGVDAAALAGALPEPTRPAFVHLDAFPGNMLADGTSITAVLDFGSSSIVGDRRLDPLAAAAYLDTAITPCATDADRRVAAAWLAEGDRAALYEPARRWLAAYWSFAQDDLRLAAWCRGVLTA